ncbi:MAG: glutamate formimidoyltransferase [Chitinophagales bacterium]|nr:glutamate formimidoyltransferase [Chitinophagales bacterium]
MFDDNQQLIECVPNFSEGRNQSTIDAIANAIITTKNIKLLHIDIGFDANRTVYSFVGTPNAVLEACLKAIQVAYELIDMSTHHGTHPRMGACDVCPLIPLQNITMQEVVVLSRQLGKRLGDIEIPVYLYEKSATNIERQNLAFLRKGEYEAIKNKLQNSHWLPDFGPTTFNKKFGMMALGARDFLIAYNINLNTKDISIAQSIAKQIRDTRAGKINAEWTPMLQHVKAIGWYIDEYDCCQVSTNITNFKKTPVCLVYNIVKSIAEKEFSITTNGSELIGLIPKAALDMKYCMFIKSPIEELALLQFTVDELGLNRIQSFNINERVLEFAMKK